MPAHFSVGGSSCDAGQVADEVVNHLAGLVDANVEIRLEITATRDDGFPDDVVRTVTENAQTLKVQRPRVRGDVASAFERA